MTLSNLMIGWPLLIGLVTVCAIVTLFAWATVKYDRCGAMQNSHFVGV
jgi:hypothetical protein